MVTKQEMKDKINEVIDNDDTFGNSIVDIADAWRDAINEKLDKMNKKDLKEIYIKSLEVA